MRYIRQHIEAIINAYDGSTPLAHFLKNYYKKHPKLGSRDRRLLSAMTYTWYRFSKGWINYSISEWLDDSEKWLSKSTTKLPDENPGINFDIDKLFPYDIELSAGITKEEWLASMLTQPALFIRIRKDKDKIVSLLTENEIPCTFTTDQCLSLPNGAKIDTLLPPDSYAVQDASSQQTGAFFIPGKNEQWYDCCSGAGGKSLLLKDIEPSVQLTISDKRDSIVHNLLQRFKLYHLTPPTSFVTDITDSQKLCNALGNKLFDNIICDAPCSGSGTWARTPEQLYFFDPSSINKYAALQRSIAVNVSAYLKPGGRLIYITCSVFKEENENIVAAITKETSLAPLRSQIINGISIHADSMFIAEFIKS